MSLYLRLVFYIGALWEILRFLFLFTGVSLLANPQANPFVNLHLLWISSGQACTALLFFLLAYMPSRFSSLRAVAAFFKLAGLLPAVALAPLYLLRPIWSAAGLTSWSPVAPPAVAAVDCFFLLHLISGTGRKLSRPPEEERRDGPDLPDHRETPIGEE